MRTPMFMLNYLQCQLKWHRELTIRKTDFPSMYCFPVQIVFTLIEEEKKMSVREMNTDYST